MLPDLVPVDWSSLEAAVFDIGGVFAIRHHEPVRRGMARGGFDLPDDDGANYHDAHYVAVHAMSSILRERGELSEHDRAFWNSFDYAYLQFLGVDDARLLEAADVLITEVFGKEPQPVWRGLLPSNIAAFQRLGRTDLPLAIVTNNDGTAEQQLLDFGVAQIGPGPFADVVAIVDSTVVGFSKPDPRIFGPALAALGTDPARTLYVGDTVHADVLGATRAGMPVVQLDPLGLHADWDHERAADLDEVVTRLARLGHRGR